MNLRSAPFARLSGFGGATSGEGRVFAPHALEELQEAIAVAQEEGFRLCLRGAGRSYGDAAYLPEELHLDCRGIEGCSVDADTGTATVMCGATIGDVWKAALPHGYWPHVVPGTMFPTVGGALAMNIHGKNAFRAGTLGDHVEWIEVLLANGEIQKFTKDHPEFFAVISSAGLLGIIVRACVRLRPITSGNLDVAAISCPDWKAQFAAFESNCEQADYMVSWIDGFSAGQGLFHAATYSQASDRESLCVEAQTLPSKILGLVPKSQVWRVLRVLNRPSLMKWLNSAKYVSGKMGRHHKFQQSLGEFSFLLDYVPGWERSYGPRGFIQYQCFVPKEAASQVFPSLIERSQRADMAPFLCVMKQHKVDSFCLSYGVEGYSIALDFKVPSAGFSKLQRHCWELNDSVLEAGGKFYLAKDSTLRPADVERWLGADRLTELQAWKRKLDPDRLFDSALARRLNLLQ